MSSVTPQSPLRRRRLPLVAAAILILLLGIFAWSRVGMLNLPAVPAGLRLDATGLAGLEEMKQLNAQIWADPSAVLIDPSSTRDVYNAARTVVHGTTPLSDAAALVQRGITAHRHGDRATALESM